MPSTSTSAVATYTQWLRERDDAALTTLLERRPDLLHPPPEDLADLSARATTASSVARVLRQLDAWQSTVLTALAALPGETSVAAVAELLGPDAGTDEVAAAIADLRDWGLVWGADDDLRLVREARTAIGPHPGGLAPPSPRPLEAAQVTAALASLDGTDRALIDRLVWGPPTGRIRDAAGRTADSPVGRLLRLGLLRIVDDDTVVLPREVAWTLRGPAPRLLIDQPGPQPPVLGDTPADRSPLRIRLDDQAALGAAHEFVHDVGACCEWVAAAPVRLLRDGGLGVRDIAALAAWLGTGNERAALLLEIAAAAGLVAPSSQHTLLPTTRYDTWLSAPEAERWSGLLLAWRDLPRWPARSTHAGHHVLGPEAEWAAAPELRTTAIAAVSQGSPISFTTAELAAVLAWRRPGWGRASWSLSEAVDELCRELVVLGALLGPTDDDRWTTTAFTTAAAAGSVPDDLAEQFPAPVTEVIIQADLTAVAPGPLEASVARTLRLLADQESRGGGAVFRFSPHSIRRAFDAGWGADEVSRWLSDHSATPVPQPLAYLVSDTARRHGAIRVGAAWCYVRTEDAAQAEAVLAHPGALALGLRAVAPGVLVASAEPEEGVALLREMGLHPAAEDASGQTMTTPAPVRVPAPAAPRVRPTVDPAGAVATLRHRERRRVELAAATDDVLTTLRSALSTGRPVRVSYVRADGTAAATTAVPTVLSGGTVRLVSAEATSSVPVSRITGAVPVAAPGASPAG